MCDTVSESDRVSPRPSGPVGPPAPAQSRDPNLLLGPGDLPLVIIAGVCIAAVLLLVLNVFVICICVNRKPKPNRQTFHKGTPRALHCTVLVPLVPHHIIAPMLRYSN